MTGDLILIIAQLEHALFQRQGNDLIYRLDITLQQALAGCHLELPHLEVCISLCVRLCVLGVGVYSVWFGIGCGCVLRVCCVWV
jgi:hypothetical protein